MQRLFSRDNHNHDQVLHEKTYNLPLLIPENQVRPPFIFHNAKTGKLDAAPYSTDNTMHTSWVPYRLGTNLNTPWGSDSNIYFNKVNPAGQHHKFLDWLDKNAMQKTNQAMQETNKALQKSIDEKVANSCAANNNSGMVCAPTCIDWWTNRPNPPQGSMQASDGSVSGGCPWGTVRGLSCYPCSVHSTYVQGKKEQK